jgi:hypothetical protein
MDPHQQQQQHAPQQAQQQPQPQPQAQHPYLSSPYLPQPLSAPPSIPPGVQIKYPAPPPSHAASAVASTSAPTSTPSPHLPATFAPPPTTTDALLDRARMGLQQLMGNGNIDSRPSRQGMPPPKSEYTANERGKTHLRSIPDRMG